MISDPKYLVTKGYDEITDAYLKRFRGSAVSLNGLTAS